MEHVLAQVNIGRLRAPLNSPVLAGFMAVLDPVNALADAARVSTDSHTDMSALWWIPDGHIPATTGAEDRIRHLRAHGPTPQAFTLRAHFPPPGSTDSAPQPGREEWMCPA